MSGIQLYVDASAKRPQYAKNPCSGMNHSVLAKGYCHDCSLRSIILSLGTVCKDKKIILDKY